MKTEPLTPTKQWKTQQLVAPNATPKLGIKGIRKRRSVKFNVENVAPNKNNKKHSPGSRQTVLSEYFTSPDKKETKPVIDSKPILDEPAPKMVNVPRLLSQLLRARVVLSRMPASQIPKPKAIKTRRQPTTITPTATVPTKNEIRSGRVVQRYCVKCKTLEFDRTDVSKRKACQTCDTSLLFICTKCNVAHFIQNRHMKKHFWRCNGRSDPNNTTSLDDVVIMFCSQCSFKSTYSYVMDKHKKHTGHEMLNGERKIEPEVVPFVPILKSEDDEKDVVDLKREKFAVKPNPNAAKKGIMRHCTKCKKKFQCKKTGDDLSCTTCKTRLMYQCGKCKFKCGTYQFIYYHVRTKCYANLYRCPKCQYTVPFWYVMSTHLKTGQCRAKVSGGLPKKKKSVTKS